MALFAAGKQSFHALQEFGKGEGKEGEGRQYMLHILERHIDSLLFNYLVLLTLFNIMIYLEQGISGIQKTSIEKAKITKETYQKKGGQE